MQASLLILIIYNLIYIKSYTLALADFPEIVSLKLALSLSSVSYITLLPLHHSHLIGYSESSQPWHLEVVSQNVFHCICTPALWALHPQETKSFHFWRLKWAACTSVSHIAVFMPSNHWRHWYPSNPTMLWAYLIFYKWFIIQGNPCSPFLQFHIFISSY